MLGYSGQLSDSRKPAWDGSRIGWDEGQSYQECLPSPPGGWIRLNMVCMVGQRKLFSVVTGNRNMSNVSPGLGWYQQAKCGICNTTVNDSMVVRTCRLLTTKSRSVREASHHSALIVSCLTDSQTCLPCQPSGYSPRLL